MHRSRPSNLSGRAGVSILKNKSRPILGDSRTKRLRCQVCEGEASGSHRFSRRCVFHREQILSTEPIDEIWFADDVDAPIRPDGYPFRLWYVAGESMKTGNQVHVTDFFALGCNLCQCFGFVTMVSSVIGSRSRIT